MIGVTAKGANETAGRIDRLKRNLPSVAERGVARGSVMVRNELVRQMSGQGRNDPFFGRMGAAPPHLAARTGATRARLSPGGRVYRRGDEVFSAVGSPDHYVKFHEDGGTIVGNQYLRIPLRAAQTPAGQDRNIGRSVRGLPGYFLVRTLGGKLIIARHRGGARSRFIEFMYLLVRSVRMPARKVFATVTERMRSPVFGELAKGVNVAVRQANHG